MLVGSSYICMQWAKLPITVALQNCPRIHVITPTNSKAGIINLLNASAGCKGLSSGISGNDEGRFCNSLINVRVTGTISATVAVSTLVSSLTPTVTRDVLSPPV